VPLLGKVPFSPDLRTGGDNGAPVVVEFPESAAAKSVSAIVDQLVVRKKSLVGVRLGLST
jgi:ATP-binding protein involved in chromosome partitioning